MKKVGIIGCGNMGMVLVDAICGLVGNDNVYCYDIEKKKLNIVKEKYKVNISNSNKDVVSTSEVILVAVKPQQIAEVLKEIKDYLKNHLLISIAAGVKISTIEKIVKKEIAIVRVMPNLPLRVSCGVSAICKNKFCSMEDYNFAKEIFRKKGVVLEVKEKFMDLITAISGSGPAYIFYISEIIQNIAKKLKLPNKIIEELVNYTVLGAAKMLTEEKISASELKNKVASKGGTTERALEVFYSYKLEKIFYKAIHNAYKRAKELSDLVDKVGV
ncbi:MAG: pyrroline-5-carboxylate reductase [Elusimicrobiota bacterium]|nr:pyrroline-5-carboxylate reductase [Endomicrobiia bacterium]MCX7910367.1 pyrroline-5-carboxylate reductase [Endomicrobiia bacterium]MDW8165564.1 pyrroline-5-carboxylate reductase [Elusimicrobiota bacterium]